MAQGTVAADGAAALTAGARASEAAKEAGFQPRYLFAVAGGAAFVLFALLAWIAVLRHLDRLPPPSFTNSLCTDEKLLDLRKHHADAAPTVLAVGSSVAWRHFDGGAVARIEAGARPLNAGFCGLRMTQTAYVAEWLLHRYPTARDVVAVVAPQDFQSCSKPEAPVFDTGVAERFLDRRSWPVSDYLSYFSFGFMANAARIKQGREARPGFEPLLHDAFGTAPIDPVASMPFKGLFYGALTDLDAGCFAALRGMAQRIAGDGRRLVVAATPLHPEWVERYGGHDAVPAEFIDRLKAAVDSTGAEVWDGHAAMGFGREAFTDAIHLHWTSAQRYSEALVAATGLGHAASAGPPGPRLVTRPGVGGPAERR